MILRRRFDILERVSLYLAIGLLLMAQYVVNSNPWDHIFRILGLIAFLGAIVMLYIERILPRVRKQIDTQSA